MSGHWVGASGGYWWVGSGGGIGAEGVGVGGLGGVGLGIGGIGGTGGEEEGLGIGLEEEESIGLEESIGGEERRRALDRSDWPMLSSPPPLVLSFCLT